MVLLLLLLLVLVMRILMLLLLSSRHRVMRMVGVMVMRMMGRMVWMTRSGRTRPWQHVVQSER
jgi:hypothetical protein